MLNSPTPSLNNVGTKFTQLLSPLPCFEWQDEEVYEFVFDLCYLFSQGGEQTLSLQMSLLERTLRQQCSVSMLGVHLNLQEAIENGDSNLNALISLHRNLHVIENDENESGLIPIYTSLPLVDFVISLIIVFCHQRCQNELRGRIILEEELHVHGPLDYGSYGTVYFGIWNHTEVAIKQLRNFGSDNTKFEQDFLREAKIMMNLAHKNIVLFYGAVLNPHKCIVTEYVQHGSIYNLLHGPRQTSKVAENMKRFTKLRLKLALDAARGMKFLHYRKVLHLDLKTQNLLVGDNYTVKVCDFGLSQFKKNNFEGKVGTVEYMAPEVLNQHEFSEKSDVFSFGVVLYEIVTLKKPWTDSQGKHILINLKILKIPKFTGGGGG